MESLGVGFWTPCCTSTSLLFCAYQSLTPTPCKLPVIWDDWIDAAQEQAQKPRAKALENHSRLQKKYEKKLADWEKRQAAGVPPPPLPDYPPLPDADTPRLKHGEMELFLKLCAALTVLLARTVYLEDLEPAHKRLLEYLHGYVEAGSSTLSLS